MKREYDFSKAEQGKFYRRGAVIQLPIYLDAKVQAQSSELLTNPPSPGGIWLLMSEFYGQHGLNGFH